MLLQAKVSNCLISWQLTPVSVIRFKNADRNISKSVKTHLRIILLSPEISHLFKSVFMHYIYLAVANLLFINN